MTEDEEYELASFNAEEAGQKQFEARMRENGSSHCNRWESVGEGIKNTWINGAIRLKIERMRALKAEPDLPPGWVLNQEQGRFELLGEDFSLKLHSEDAFHSRIDITPFLSIDHSRDGAGCLAAKEEAIERLKGILAELEC